MEVAEEGGIILGNPNLKVGRDMGGFSADGTCFDASQYDFFGKNVLQEVELGGLDDEEENGRAAGLDDEDLFYSLSRDKEDAVDLGSLSDLDDLASTFSKLNRTVSEPKNIGAIRGFYPRESSSTADWSQDSDISNYLDQRLLNAENIQDGKRWWSQPYNASNVVESKPLHRTSSYPYPQAQQHHENQLKESILGRKTSFPHYPPSSAMPHNFNLTRHLSIPSLDSGLQTSFPALNVPPFSVNQNPMASLSRRLSYDGSGGPFTFPGLQINNQEQNWLSHPNLFPMDQPYLLPNLLQQQLHYNSSLMNSNIFPPNQLQRLQFPPSHYNLLNLQHQFFNKQPSPSQTRNTYDMIGSTQTRDQRGKSRKGKQNLRLSHQSSDASDAGSHKSDTVSKFRSKYMSSEELESVMKMQHAVTRNNDPYIDDYYHLACLEKKSIAAGMKPHFCPASIHDAPGRGHGSSESHANIVYDAVGKAAISSIRRSGHAGPPASAKGVSEPKSSRPLEQEPMLATRIIIEDGVRVLLDVDDINRFLKYGQSQDGSSQLVRRRQLLLEGLAASLQLVDPLGAVNMGNASGITPKDDLVFLQIVSLPKGRKLFSRIIRLTTPGSELARVVCMTVFRHLRVLFGGLSADSSASQTTTDLAASVALSVLHMDLNALGACIAAVVCSTEQPPLRPLGSSAGDGASVVIKSVLEQATKLLTDPLSARNYSMSVRALWQASFDAFFGLLTKYCEGKYESIRQSLLSQEMSMAAVEDVIARAISREMPVELLRESLPHTNELQKQRLLEFVQKTMPVTSARGRGGRQMDVDRAPG